MEHFWLNEGFTVWAERRILEALHGEEATVLAWAIGEKALEESMSRFGANSPLTRLRTELAGMDPDDAFSSIPYEKGSRFVALLERGGRDGRASTASCATYMDRFRFTSITTEEFLAFLEQQLPGVAAAGGRPGVAVRAGAAGQRAGLPLAGARTRSSRWPPASRAARGRRAAQIAGWSPAETLVYLQNLPRVLDRADCAWLDEALSLTGRGNYEILVEWLTIAAASDYEPVFARLREVLLQVGRMKYLRPALHGARAAQPRTRALARELFAQAAPRYHQLSRRVVAASVIAKYEDEPAATDATPRRPHERASPPLPSADDVRLPDNAFRTLAAGRALRAGRAGRRARARGHAALARAGRRSGRSCSRPPRPTSRSSSARGSSRRSRSRSWPSASPRSSSRCWAARASTLLENVNVLAIGATSGIVAGGSVFTMPAIYILGLQGRSSFLQIFLVPLLGAVLGVFLLAPFRRYFVRDLHGKLPYPGGPGHHRDPGRRPARRPQRARADLVGARARRSSTSSAPR